MSDPICKCGLRKEQHDNPEEFEPRALPVPEGSPEPESEAIRLLREIGSGGVYVRSSRGDGSFDDSALICDVSDILAAIAPASFVPSRTPEPGIAFTPDELVELETMAQTELYMAKGGGQKGTLAHAILLKVQEALASSVSGSATTGTGVPPGTYERMVKKLDGLTPANGGEA